MDNEFLSDFRSKFGKESVMFLNDLFQPENIPGYVSTGSFAIDYIIGHPGLPMGRITEISGFFSSGKSTVAASCIGQCQQKGGISILFDTEHSYIPQWTELFHVDPEKLILPQSYSLQEVCEHMVFLTNKVRESNPKNGVLIVWDSIASTPAQEEIDGEITDHTVGLHARIISKALRKLTSIIWDQKIAVLFINQLKEKPMSFGKSYGKIGGHACNYHSAVQIELFRVQAAAEGITVKATAVKNKIATPFKKSTFRIDFATGIDDTDFITQLALDKKILEKTGGWYEFQGDKYRKGPKLFNMIAADILESTFGKDYASNYLLNRRSTEDSMENSTEDSSEDEKDIDIESVVEE